MPAGGGKGAESLYLVSQEVVFEKIHDLRRLLDYCVATDDAFETLRDMAEPLTLYAVAFRYPGPAEPSREEVGEALRVVKEIWDFVTARLPDEVVP